LLALIRVNQQNNFVMTHAYSLWIKATRPASSSAVWQEKPQIITSCGGYAQASCALFGQVFVRGICFCGANAT
jgi:hypothetical protein